MKCKYCNGKGMIKIQTVQELGGFTKYDVEIDYDECENCDGSGEVDNNE